MSHFPPHFAVLPCALLAATLLASCASEPPAEDVRSQPPTPPVTALTSEASPSPDRVGGAGTHRSPKQQEPKEQEPKEPAPKRSTDPSPKSDGTPSSREDAPDPTRTGLAPNLPSGSEKVLDGRRMVALYGAPGTPSLGALGEQSLDKSIRRVKRLARRYDGLTRDDVVPTFELIATVAATEAGDDRDFSSELSLSTLRPWVERAAKEGVYVVLDLQPGRSDFVRQAKKYAPLLKYPHVGLALDPEWRLGPKERHLEQIGSVHASEVNDTIDWLAAFTRRNDLPQKLLILHQFRTSMIANRKVVRTDHDTVSVLIHADGQGKQSAKRVTWQTLHKGAPKGVRWGWKNFIDEDHPMLTPKQTYRIKPTPDFVSYQ
ncbi:MAG: hypothetical protein L0K86_12460 [Actinomycetia bacterium]|nr:hypothetical protein [Actinomycetes bacterium]